MMLMTIDKRITRDNVVVDVEMLLIPQMPLLQSLIIPIVHLPHFPADEKKTTVPSHRKITESKSSLDSGAASQVRERWPFPSQNQQGS